MAQKRQELATLLANAKKRSKLYKVKRTEPKYSPGPLTKEAQDWRFNNASLRNQAELERRIPNPVTRQKLEKERPMTTLNRRTGSVHSNENEIRLNTSNKDQYNQMLNLVTARNTMRRKK